MEEVYMLNCNGINVDICLFSNWKYISMDLFLDGLCVWICYYMVYVY